MQGGTQRGAGASHSLRRRGGHNWGGEGFISVKLGGGCYQDIE